MKTIYTNNLNTILPQICWSDQLKYINHDSVTNDVRDIIFNDVFGNLLSYYCDNSITADFPHKRFGNDRIRKMFEWTDATTYRTHEIIKLMCNYYKDNHAIRGATERLAALFLRCYYQLAANKEYNKFLISIKETVYECNNVIAFLEEINLQDRINNNFTNALLGTITNERPFYSLQSFYNDLPDTYQLGIKL